MIGWLGIIGRKLSFLLVLVILMISATNILLCNEYNFARVTYFGFIDNLKIYVVYDNNAYREDLMASWGLSLYIEAGNTTILFDTGGDGKILLSNMKKLGLNPKNVDIVVISHIHSDHLGGLYDFLKVNPNVTVYIPNGFPDDVVEHIKSYGVVVKPLPGPAIIAKGVLSTGGLETDIGLYEQSLVINTTKGLVILSGCAHPGIDRIVEKIVEITGYDKILLVGGGFHLAGVSDDRIIKIINTFKRYHVEYVMPIHCSGDRARELFHEHWGEHCILAGVGYVLDIDNLPSRNNINNLGVKGSINNSGTQIYPIRGYLMVLLIAIVLATITVLIVRIRRKH